MSITFAALKHMETINNQVLQVSLMLLHICGDEIFNKSFYRTIAFSVYSPSIRVTKCR